MIPEFLNKPNVLGIGEIGLNKNTRNESTIFQEHVDLAMKTNELILIHTPHLEDKYKGTRMIIDMLKNDKRVDPQRVLIDHVEEHTVRHALDNGFWCAMTLYPTTKCTPQRAADIIEMVGTDRIMANSAGDWGKSDPLAVPELILELRRRGHADSAIRKLVYENPLAFWRMSNRWQEWPVEEPLSPAPERGCRWRWLDSVSLTASLKGKGDEVNQVTVSRNTRLAKGKVAPVIILRSVPTGYSWGWFAREDSRMHLQTVDKKNRNRYKVWLENGMRTFEPAESIPAKILKPLEAEVNQAAAT